MIAVNIKVLILIGIKEEVKDERIDRAGIFLDGISNGASNKVNN